MSRKLDHMPPPRINVVPIIDVSLVLVLTMMMISPFLNHSEMKIDLPDARTTQTEDQDKVEILFTKAGKLAVQEEPVALEDLAPVLAGHFQGHPSLMAVLKADEGIPYGSIEQVLSAIQSAGAPRIALATEQKKQGVAR